MMVLSDLALFHFIFKYWPGKSNKAADALSHCAQYYDSGEMDEAKCGEYEIVSYATVCKECDRYSEWGKTAC